MSRVTEILCVTCSGCNLCYATIDLHDYHSYILFLQDQSLPKA